MLPNLYGLQEFVYTPDQKTPTWHTEIKVEKGKVQIPKRAGLGIEYDVDTWQKAEKIL